MHSFYAFIDEAGDEGFTFKDLPERASSEWFIISAIVIRASSQAAVARKLNETLGPIEANRKSPAHFVRLPHEARVALIHKISSLPCRTISVCFNKKSLDQHTLGDNRRLYFYCTRYLIERLSWLARDTERKDGDGTCKLTFAHSKRLSYEDIRKYFHWLKDQKTQVNWPNIDVNKLSVEQHNQSIWLRAADAIASGIFRGLEVNEYGFSEDRYARMLKPVVYCRDENYFSYGMKLFPTVPRLDVDRDNRYGWLDLYKKGGATRNEVPNL